MIEAKKSATVVLLSLGLLVGGPGIGVAGADQTSSDSSAMAEVAGKPAAAQRSARSPIGEAINGAPNLPVPDSPGMALGSLFDLLGGSLAIARYFPQGNSGKTARP